MLETLTASPLARTIAETPTDIWNDSCAVDELEYAIAFGAVGATANPTIVHDVWKKDPSHWRREPAPSRRGIRAGPKSTSPGRSSRRCR